MKLAFAIFGTIAALSAVEASKKGNAMPESTTSNLKNVDRFKSKKTITRKVSSEDSKSSEDADRLKSKKTITRKVSSEDSKSSEDASTEKKSVKARKITKDVPKKKNTSKVFEDIKSTKDKKRSRATKNAIGEEKKDDTRKDSKKINKRLAHNETNIPENSENTNELPENPPILSYDFEFNISFKGTKEEALELPGLSQFLPGQNWQLGEQLFGDPEIRSELKKLTITATNLLKMAEQSNVTELKYALNKLNKSGEKALKWFTKMNSRRNQDQK